MAYWHVVWLCMLITAIRAKIQTCAAQQVHDLRLLMASHACTSTRLRMTASTRGASAFCNRCRNAGPVTQHRTDPYNSSCVPMF